MWLLVLTLTADFWNIQLQLWWTFIKDHMKTLPNLNPLLMMWVSTTLMKWPSKSCKLTALNLRPRNARSRLADRWLQSFTMCSLKLYIMDHKLLSSLILVRHKTIKVSFYQSFHSLKSGSISMELTLRDRLKRIQFSLLIQNHKLEE